jgi:2-hydroxychromene-2-carboxylate isomerase
MAKHVDYYVSLNSPWTYLGSRRFEVIAQKHKADVTIWPVDFGSVFAVSGGLPLPKRAPQRQAYRMMELKRWRDHLGVLAALWAEEKNTGDPATLRAIIAECGIDADALIMASEALEIAGKREAYTRHAIDQGVFGAPSFVIDGEIFWGQDRLDFVDRKLNG